MGGRLAYASRGRGKEWGQLNLIQGGAKEHGTEALDVSSIHCMPSHKSLHFISLNVSEMQLCLQIIATIEGIHPGISI